MRKGRQRRAEIGYLSSPKRKEALRCGCPRAESLVFELKDPQQPRVTYSAGAVRSFGTGTGSALSMTSRGLHPALRFASSRRGSERHGAAPCWMRLQPAHGVRTVCAAQGNVPGGSWMFAKLRSMVVSGPGSLQGKGLPRALGRCASARGLWLSVPVSNVKLEPWW